MAILCILGLLVLTGAIWIAIAVEYADECEEELWENEEEKR